MIEEEERHLVFKEIFKLTKGAKFSLRLSVSQNVLDLVLLVLVLVVDSSSMTTVYEYDYD